MKTCQYAGEPFGVLRSHPWTDSVEDADCRYYDFVREPEKISTVLEDFRPFDHFAAVQSFYEWVKFLNASESTLETNDCALTEPGPNTLPEVDKALQCEGRIMVLFRDQRANLSLHRVEALEMQLHMNLAPLDETFEFGLVGTTVCPVRYILLQAPERNPLGHQLMISFWAWGNTEAEVMDHLGRLFCNLREALTKSMKSA